MHPEVRMNFLASPPLVVAYALAGSLDINLTTEPLGTSKDGKPVYLADIWPTDKEVQDTLLRSIDSDMFRNSYASVFTGDANWQNIKAPTGKRYTWEEKSTYVRNPPYFEGMTMTPAPLSDISGARALAVLGDSVTTDHISPAGNIAKTSPAARYLMEQGVQPVDFNSYWRAPWQPRSDDPRHLREHPAAQLVGSGRRRRGEHSPSQRRADFNLRRGHALQVGRHPAHHPRGP